MRLIVHDDPAVMPVTELSPEQLFQRAVTVRGTPGEAYVERRGIPVGVAESAGVRFDRNFGGRAAIVAATRAPDDAILSVHGRYLQVNRRLEKMLTVGAHPGLFPVLRGWQDDPVIVVEGIFDALSLASCGYSAVATIGRRIPWLPELTAGRTVWLAFDAGAPGDLAAAQYRKFLALSSPRRLRPPDRCKDWNTALLKRGASAVRRWVRDRLKEEGT